jgi:hypothetical protein
LFQKRCKNNSFSEKKKQKQEILFREMRKIASERVARIERLEAVHLMDL